MKNKLFAFIALSVILFSCSKSNDDTSTTTTATTSEVLNDFVNKTAIPTYYSLDTAALALKTALNNLNTQTTDANLTIAKAKWQSIRAIWEQSEGFLIGPVESEDYDPNTDTWPTDYNEMDSLLNKHSTATTLLTEAQVAALSQSLRGYHPIEYIIFGNHGDRKAADLTQGQLAYMVGLAADLYDNNVHQLYLAWTGSDPYGNQLINAGKSSSQYEKVQDAIWAIANGMADICNEVSQDGEDGKINGPYIGNNGAGDPNLVESPYSGNSWTDFKNNIIGAQNVYLGVNSGVGISAIVSQYNKDLDNTIKTQFASAISSFNNLGSTYFEEAILASSGKRALVEQTRQAIKTLQATLESKLLDKNTGLIVSYIKN
ncbi:MULTISPECIES: imelysin family protein [Chitinophagaceae]